MCARADWPGLDNAILPPPYQTLILLDSKSGSSCHNNNNNNNNNTDTNKHTHTHPHTDTHTLSEMCFYISRVLVSGQDF